MFDPLTFDRCLPVEVPVTIAGTRYTLREKDAVADAAYKGALASAMRGQSFKPGDTPDINQADFGKLNFADMVLLSECLYVGDAVPLLTDGSPNRAYLVGLDTVKSWRASLTSKLVERLKEISDDGTGNDADTPKTLAEKITDLQRRRDVLVASGAAEDETGLKN